MGNMTKKIGTIRDENASFYRDTILLKNKAYVRELGSLNSIIGLLYIIISSYFATVVKDYLKTYQFVLRAAYEDLGDLEVLEWAARQTRNTFFDWTQFTIFAFSGAMAMLVIWVSFGVKKYELYKHQRKYLFGLLGLAVAQTICAAFIPWLNTNGSQFHIAVALFSWFLQIAVLFPQIFGSEMFYPLEFKNLSTVMKALNWGAEVFLKQLDEKNV